MIATRYAAVTACLIGLALVPTVAHTYMNMEGSDGQSVTAIPVRLAGMASAPTARSAAWVEEAFSSRDWIERTYRAPDGRRILLFAARTADTKKLYHHPELAVLYGRDSRNLGVIHVASSPGVPVHLLETSTRRGTGLAAYVLMHGSEFVSDPVAFQLRSAVKAVFTRPRRMTLIFVHDPDGKQPFDGSAAHQLLVEAAKAFARQPAPGKI